MALLDLWDYVRASGDRRLRKQGYVGAGVGILERYRRVSGFWGPHLERNRANLNAIAAQLGSTRGGTLLILGAGRLLDVPWEQLFPCFERVVLADADFGLVPYVERVVAAAKLRVNPKIEFDIGDLTDSVVDVAAWAEHTIGSAQSPAAAGKSLAEGFDCIIPPQAKWSRTYADVRAIISTNLVSQLGYFPRLHVQSEFRKRFKSEFSEQTRAAASLENYFNRIRARHFLDLAQQQKAFLYVASDIKVHVYRLKPMRNILTESVPPDAGVKLDDRGNPVFHWPVEIIDESDPLNGQILRELWPTQSQLLPPQRWAWHIVPQGSEKKYQDRGRIHIVEAWTRSPLSP
jgi:hypothetical protein